MRHRRLLAAYVFLTVMIWTVNLPLAFPEAKPELAVWIPIAVPILIIALVVYSELLSLLPGRAPPRQISHRMPRSIRIAAMVLILSLAANLLILWLWYELTIGAS